MVNSVPDEVIIDTYVRGATFEAIQKGDAAVERAVTESFTPRMTKEAYLEYLNNR